MRNLKGINLRIVLLAILGAAVFAPSLVYAIDYTVGVKAGDWVKYGQITVTWTGNGTEPSYVTETKKVDWTRIDVLSVVGTTVSLNQTVHFNNGTQSFQSPVIDIQSSNSAGNSYLIASNLTAGDPLTSQTPGTTINQTVTGLYAGANRNVNMINYRGNLTSAQVNYPFEYKTYWDQRTGVMVELYINGTDMIHSGAYEEISFKAIETNLWTSSAFDIIQNNLIYIIAGIAVIIIIVAVTIVLRRRKLPSTQQPLLPQPPSVPSPPISFNSKPSLA